MRISKTIKDFLLQESTEELLEDNDFEGLYDELSNVVVSENYPELVSQMTQILYAAGMDPLQYLNDIPAFFLTQSDIESFDVPNHIQTIDEYAFSDCLKLTNVEIGKGVTDIHEYAFAGCMRLESIKIPSSVDIIEDTVFEGCISLKEIKYAGTAGKWNRLNVNPYNNGCKVACVNGTLIWDDDAEIWIF